ncbi:MAG: GNAT family N-acetyltransferase [Archangium sp.]
MTARLARKEDLPAVRAVLARAFVDDPQLKFVLAPGFAALEAFFEVTTNKLTFPYGEVLCDDQMRGAALWTPPGKFQISWYQQLLNAPMWARAIGWLRLIPMLRATAPLDDAHPKEPHYYLFAIGVEREHRGKGLSAQLIEPVTAKCDATGTLAYLEASSPDLVPLYARFGFRAQREIRLGGDGPPVTTMLRTPVTK